MSWRGRLIAEDYSNSTQQKRSQSNYWQQLYWGRLRLDSIVARTLVIPDTYLIDGRFFLSTGQPDAIVAENDQSPLRWLSIADAAAAAAGNNLSETIARAALLLGAEGPGLTPAAVAASDVVLSIPMADGVDSLNVATAAAIAFHALSRP